MDTGTLAAPGAELYYEVRGSGPALLLVNGGDGDAAMFAPLAEVLAEDHTVITYDRRGNSRSRLTGPPAEQRIKEHADDALLLLRAVAGGPAHVVGSSYGGMIGMDLLSRHPGQVGTVVAHEPFVVEMLPDAARWHAFFEEVHETHRRDGVGEALARFAGEIGVAAPPAPSDDQPEPVREMLVRIQGNLDTGLARELRSFARYRPDLAALRRGRFVPAAGVESRGTLPHRAAAALAEGLGVTLVEFPGDHVGWLTAPAEFSQTLRAVLLA